MNNEDVFDFFGNRVFPYIPQHYNAEIGGLASTLSGKKNPSQPVPSSGDKWADVISRMSGKALASAPIVNGVIEPLSKDLMGAKSNYATIPLVTTLAYAMAANRAENEGSPLDIGGKINQVVGSAIMNMLKYNKPKLSQNDNSNDIAYDNK